MCVGVRPPLGVSSLVKGMLWRTDPHLFVCLLFPSAANGCPPALREEISLSFTRAKFLLGGQLFIVMWNDLPGGVASRVSSKGPFGNTV